MKREAMNIIAPVVVKVAELGHMKAESSDE
jgi:hypothetical protein